MPVAQLRVGMEIGDLGQISFVLRLGSCDTEPVTLDGVCLGKVFLLSVFVRKTLAVPMQKLPAFHNKR